MNYSVVFAVALVACGLAGVLFMLGAVTNVRLMAWLLTITAAIGVGAVFQFMKEEMDVETLRRRTSNIDS